MEWLMFGLLFVGSALASAGMIAKKNAQAGDMIAKLAPYQSWIGLALLGWGLFAFLFRFLFWIRAWSFVLRFMPVFAIAYLAVIILSILLGLILSMNFLKTRKEIPQDKLASIDAKISKFQSPLGIAGLIACIIFIISYIVKF